LKPEAAEFGRAWERWLPAAVFLAPARVRAGKDAGAPRLRPRTVSRCTP